MPHWDHKRTVVFPFSYVEGGVQQCEKNCGKSIDAFAASPAVSYDMAASANEPAVSFIDPPLASRPKFQPWA